MERIRWIDVAKGWGIIFVVYGHIASDYLTVWLYTFHVPLFLFLSGYFFNPEKRPSAFFKSKVKGLLLPYVTLGLPILLLNVSYGLKPLQLLQSYAVQCRASTLWYIATLFMQFALAYAVYHWVVSKSLRWVVIFILAFVGIILWHIGILSLPWNLDVSLVTLPFFCLSYDLRRSAAFQKLFSDDRLLRNAIAFLLINIVGTVLMYLLPFPTVDLYASRFSFEPLAYCTAFAGIMTVCLFSYKWPLKLLSYIGQNSLVYFVWQQDIAIMIVTKVMCYIHIFDGATGIVLFVRNIIILLFSLAILTVFNEIIIKTKLRVLIGKR